MLQSAKITISNDNYARVMNEGNVSYHITLYEKNVNYILFNSEYYTVDTIIICRSSCTFFNNVLMEFSIILIAEKLMLDGTVLLYGCMRQIQYNIHTVSSSTLKFSTILVYIQPL